MNYKEKIQELIIDEALKYLYDEIENKVTKKTNSKRINISLIDSKYIKANSIKNKNSDIFPRNKKIEAIHLLALRFWSKKTIHIKNFLVYFIPMNTQNDIYMGEYYSNYIHAQLNEKNIEMKISVSPEDDFFINASIDEQNKIFILPFVFSRYFDTPIENFSNIIFIFSDQNNNTYCTNIELKNNAKCYNYITQRVKIETKSCSND